ncbi:Membrane steroid-binding protein 2 [Linum perenne]
MALQLWETLQQAITAYTGLTPATFFSVLAFGLAVYYLLTGMYGSTNPPPRPRSFDEDVQPLPPPVQLGEIGEDELKQYDGTDPKKPLLMAIKGQIYDVSQSSQEGDFGMNYELYLLEVASCGLLRLVSNDVLRSWWTIRLICRERCQQGASKDVLRGQGPNGGYLGPRFIRDGSIARLGIQVHEQVCQGWYHQEGGGTSHRWFFERAACSRSC